MPESENTELATLIVSKLIERRDVKAIQTASGGYQPVRVDPRDTESDLIPWCLQDVVDHIEGRATYGHYVVSQQGTCRTFVFDIDLRAKANPKRNEPPIILHGREIDPREIWRGEDTPAKRSLAYQLRVMAEQLAIRTKELLEVQVMVSYSGNKGMHVYACLDRGTQASEARKLANLVMDSYDGLFVTDRGNNFFKHYNPDTMSAISLEVFPKQDEVKENAFGNLIRLPLGVNRKSGKKGWFMDLDTPVERFLIDDPMTALTKGSIR